MRVNLHHDLLAQHTTKRLVSFYRASSFRQGEKSCETGDRSAYNNGFFVLVGLRNQSETCAGCIVSCTTPTSRSLSSPRLLSLCRPALKRSITRLALYF